MVMFSYLALLDYKIGAIPIRACFHMLALKNWSLRW
jgi:hypothetical protein